MLLCSQKRSDVMEESFPLKDICLFRPEEEEEDEWSLSS
jgi:hypothetical protein